MAAAAAGAPAATSADFSVAALEILAPSTPIVTTWPWLVSGVPSAPRTAARAGQVVRRDSWSPARSGGAIVAGDHFTSHVPCDSTRCKADLMVMVPRPASVRRSVTGALAVDVARVHGAGREARLADGQVAERRLVHRREVGRRAAGQLLHRGPVLPGPGGQVGGRRRLRAGARCCTR